MNNLREFFNFKKKTIFFLLLFCLKSMNNTISFNG